ncbi:MAG: GAF domain-containing sensor histidine kinase [Deltaproteobacteria bacterium]|nr:GAF domain-containing sensor histidine kinase [Deltaproteobacteria bacterium]MBT7715939.1 GAF domain-containing sensor histidine kinase [Deltaproteobacteria bacterium]
MKDYLDSRRDFLFERLMEIWQQQPESQYKEFILKTDEGRRRVRIWINLLLDALNGDKQKFREDQFKVGYARAMKGLQFDNVVKHVPFFMKIIGDIFPEEISKNNWHLENVFTEIKELMDLLFEDTLIIASSFVNTREEIINEKAAQLESLYDYTRDIITIDNLDEIAETLIKKTVSLSGADEVSIGLYKDLFTWNFRWYPKPIHDPSLKKIAASAIREGIPIFIDEQHHTYRDLTDDKLKSITAIPIGVEGSFCYGVIVINSQIQGFELTKKHMKVLAHFIDITKVALKNIYNLGEIEQHRQELRLTASKLMTIQEEERKRLAEDIHDSIAQSLIGLGYKMQISKRLLQEDPEKLDAQFEGLLGNIDNIIDESRQIITNLRPDLIDTIGILPALERLFDSFQTESGINVSFTLPENMAIPSAYGICIFRIVQESLANIHKHAATDTATVTIEKSGETVILVIADKGRGFDISSGYPWIKNPDKFGLLSMKGRVESLGGEFKLQTGHNQGCRLEARIHIIEENDGNS